MLEAKNAPSPDAMPHLLLTGIVAGVQKGKAKVELGIERAELKRSLCSDSPIYL